jgi:hypothetical protein
VAVANDRFLILKLLEPKSLMGSPNDQLVLACHHGSFRRSVRDEKPHRHMKSREPKTRVTD